jgi:hypothetical protein
VKVLLATLVLTLLYWVHAATASRSDSAGWLWRSFLCIHSHEGAWDDAGSPYYGGLQMDLTFQRTYGGEFLSAFGTADHWPPAIQITVAMRAYLSGRGFGPWPTTRRLCGL